MDKRLLPAIIFLGTMYPCSGQNGNFFLTPVSPAVNNIKLNTDNKFADNDPGTIFSKGKSMLPLNKNAIPVTLAANETQIGTTTYDLQTNGSVPNRIVYNSNGSVQATWTFSAELNAAWSDRGTGYNYYNGNSWGAAPASRIEGSIRTGWPEIVTLANGKEVVISHDPANTRLILSSRTPYGSGNWNVSAITALAPSSQIWPRAASGGTNGNTIHLIAHAGATTMVNGVRGMIFYSRSLDGGVTWDIQNIQLPGIDNTNYTYISGDKYAISANGNDVAVVYFGDLNKTLLVKSVDNGANWTATLLFNMPFLYDPNSSNTIGSPIGISDNNSDGIADTILSTDGRGTVIVDNSGTAHVYFGFMRYLDAIAGDGTWSLFPGTNGIAYWNESMGTTVPQYITGALDVDGSGTLLDDAGTGIQIAQYYSSLSSYPSAGVDSNDCLYLVYSAIVETLNNGSQFYRHIYGIKSCDNGCSWSFPVDLTNGDDFAECVFPSMAHSVGAKFHFLYQKDAEPGLNLQGDQDPVAVNSIIYANENVSRLDSNLGSPTSLKIIAASDTICSGATVILSANNVAGATWQWSTGATTQSINVNSAGTYTVTATNWCGTYTGTKTLITVAAPAATVSGDTAICPGDSTLLTAGSGNVNSYLWSTGETTQSIYADSVGTYLLYVYGCGGSDTQSITIGASSASAAITAYGPTTFCEGDSVELAADQATSYLWSTGDTTDYIIVTSSGNYSVTTQSACGTAISNPTTVTVNPNPIPTITVNGPTTFCTGGNVMLTSSSANGYLWSNGQNAQSITVDSSGNYSVLVLDANGCEGTSSPISVIVTTTPTATITTSGPITFCQGDSVTLTGNQGTAYQWSNGESTSSINVSQSGNYTVTITDAGGCTGTAVSSAVAVTVNANPVPVITPGGPLTFCQGDSVLLTSTAASTYSWSSNQTAQTITVTSSGNYSVTVTDVNGCIGSSSAVSVTSNPNPNSPSITASGPTTFCQGENITLVSSSGSGNTWSNGANTQFINVNTSGNYSVTVTDGNGCSASSSITTVTVNPLPDATITANGLTSFCEGGTVLLISGTASGNTWSTNETSQFISVDTTLTVILIVTDTNGCIDSDTVSIVENAPPAVTITTSGNTTFCEGDSVLLDAGSGFTDYLWNTGSTTQIVVADTSGNFNVTVTDVNGCIGNSAAITVTVNPNPSTPMVNPSGPLTICEGDSVILSSNLISGNLWNTGETNQLITVDTTGDYFTTITGGGGCTSVSNTVTVVVNPLPTVTVSTSGPITFCQGESVVLTSSSVTGNVWSTSATTQSITVTASGNYYVSLTQNGCLSNSLTVNVTVNPLPSVPLINQSGNALACSVSGMDDYLWQYMGDTITTCNTQYCTCIGDGFYTVEITDANGCKSISTPTSVNGCTSGINDGSSDDIFHIYPNPNYGRFVVSFNKEVNGSTRIIIFNMLGEMIYNANTSNPQTEINLSLYNSGIYNIMIMDETGTMNKRIIVEQYYLQS